MFKNLIHLFMIAVIFVLLKPIPVLAKTPGVAACVPTIAGGAFSLLPEALAKLAPSHIFEPDDRKDVSFEDAKNVYPYSKIGILAGTVSHSGQLTQYCSAALVGENLVLTNLHCLESMNGRKFTFYAGYTEGQWVAKSTVTDVYYNRVEEITENREIKYRNDQDFAVLVLREPIGKKVGYFKTVSDLSTLKIPTSVRTIGYTTDKANMQDQTCLIQDLDLHQLNTDCDILKGASGSPLLFNIAGEYQIVGLNAGYYTPKNVDLSADEYLRLKKYAYPYASTAVKPTAFIETIQRARQKHPVPMVALSADEADGTEYVLTSTKAISDEPVNHVSQVDCDASQKTHTLSLNDPIVVDDSPTTVANSVSDTETTTVVRTSSMSPAYDAATSTKAEDFSSTTTVTH
ncbi:MAG: trypsin-like serine protease [Bdellovibrionota bacterium]